MVKLPLVRASNANINVTLHTPTALFVGATAGIGEATLKAFVQNTSSPTIYLVGRSQASADAILNDCRNLNTGGTYTFIRSDVSLLANVDTVCEDIKSKEKKLDLMVLSCGYLSFDGRNETKEGLDTLLSLRYYARLRFIQQLLPLHPSRILSILAATNEGALIEDDLDLKHNYGIGNCANHAATMTSLAFEQLSQEHPKTSFVHALPGIVKTGIFGKEFSWWVIIIMQWIIVPLLTPIAVPVEEVGERQLFHATSARYPPKKSAESGEEARRAGVARPQEVDVAKGDGAYLLNWNGETGEGKRMKGYRERGMGKKVWEHTLHIFNEAQGKTR